MTKSLTFVAFVSLLGLGSVSTASANPPNRDARQDARIHQGVTEGDLTPAERLALRAEQRRIDRLRRNARRDGVITPREAHKLHVSRNRANDHIYRLRHNRRHM